MCVRLCAGRIPFQTLVSIFISDISISQSRESLIPISFRLASRRIYDTSRVRGARFFFLSRSVRPIRLDYITPTVIIAFDP